MNREKKHINNWLNKEISENYLVIDSVLDIFEDILSEFATNGWKLRQDEDTFLMNLIYYLYDNSYTSIQNIR